jgi:hypothetical protein
MRLALRFLLLVGVYLAGAGAVVAGAAAPVALQQRAG